MYEDCTSTLWLNSAHGEASGLWKRTVFGEELRGRVSQAAA
jgi:hypothetical protein